MAGFLILPVYYFTSYHIVTRQDGSILFIPQQKKTVEPVSRKKSKETSFAKETPVRTHEEICARNRWLIKKAVLEYSRKYGVNQKKIPTIFDLMGHGYLKEFPNCPDGGAYTIGYLKDQPEVECSIHGKSD